ncbi:MAG: hypothetical protein KHW82_12765 [Lachnospiraceae bacterium]|nr:hypothetical protein [Lachnospiraceae bacterium]
MKTIKYAVKIVRERTLTIGALTRVEVEKELKRWLQEEPDVLENGDKLIGMMVEEKGERNCRGDCNYCEYHCPKDEDCMADDLTDRCLECELQCKVCGNCTVKDDGVCGDDDCQMCHWRCKTCGCCTHPPGMKLP